MASPNLQVFGGNFQDSEGSVLNGGYLLWQLSHDELYSSGNAQIVAGLKFTMTLNASGSVPSSPATMIYDNSSLLPSGSFYTVRAFTSDGREAWAFPQYFQLTSSPNPLDLGTLIPVNPQGGLVSGGGGSGTVSSVGLSMPAEFTVSGSPVTTSGTLTVTKANESANTVFAGPTSGGAAQPTFRVLVAADISGALPGLSTSGQGGFFGPGLLIDGCQIDQLANSTAIITTNNEVRVTQFVLNVAITIRKVSVAMLDNLAFGNTATFGIYSTAGNLLLDGGLFNTLTSPTVQTSTLGSPVVLSAGVYLLAQASTTSSSSHIIGITPSTDNLHGQALYNANSTRYGVATNTLTAGALPATLGVISAATPTSVSIGIACPFFEP